MTDSTELKKEAEGRTRSVQDDALVMPEYSQGVCQDGAAILKNGVQLTMEEILTELRDNQEKIHQIKLLSDAYPESVFGEPNWKEVRHWLSLGGISVDSVSASNMRVVANNIKEILEA